MHDEYLKLSQFIDNELDHEQSLQLLDKMARDRDLEQTYRRYGAVSQAMKSEVFLSVSDDFVRQVSDRIKSEPSYLIPRNNRKKFQILSLSAVAASLAVVAVMLIKNYPSDAYVSESPLTIANNNSSQNQSSYQPFIASQRVQNKGDESIQMVAGSRHMNNSITRRQPRMQPVNSKFNDYLQAHSGNLYSSGADFQAYAQVAGYGQE